MRFLVLAFGVGLAGCAGAPSESPAPAPTPVTVSRPIERDVTDFADFTARTAAVDSVELRARASGYLDKVNFKEGSLVKKGDLLFEIDPRTYAAELKLTQGNLETVEAAQRVAGQAKAGGRDADLIVLGRDAPAEQLDHWLEVASQVDAFVGFAIGRSIWEDAVREYEESGQGETARAKARDTIAERYLGFISHWTF